VAKRKRVSGEETIRKLAAGLGVESRKLIKE
jgi:hypothetical protein